jgi:hypothetical protein
MTERTRIGVESTENDPHLPLSKLLIGTAVGCVATTTALIIAIVTELSSGSPPPPPPTGSNGTPPPPPHELESWVLFPILTGLFVLAWLAFLVAFSRDQILRSIRANRGTVAPDPGPSRQEIHDLMESIRDEIAEDHRQELSSLEARIASLTTEYGEQRETEGYINGMRVARSEQSRADVRPIRKVPPAN